MVSRLIRWLFVLPPDINECEPQPCLGGGECVDQVANFTCVCPAAFTGELCQTGDFTLTGTPVCLSTGHLGALAFLFGLTA